MELAQTQEKRWQKSLHVERQRRVTLEETVEALARQHNTLERACRKSTGANLADIPEAELGRDSDEEEEAVEEEDDENAEFFDAIAEHPEGFTIPVSKSHESLQSTSSDTSTELEGASKLGTDKGEASEDTAATETTTDVVFATGREESQISASDDANAGLKIVTAPFTVEGSFGLSSVSINNLAFRNKKSQSQMTSKHLFFFVHLYFDHNYTGWLN